MRSLLWFALVVLVGCLPEQQLGPQECEPETWCSYGYGVDTQANQGSVSFIDIAGDGDNRWIVGERPEKTGALLRWDSRLGQWLWFSDGQLLPGISSLLAVAVKKDSVWFGSRSGSIISGMPFNETRAGLGAIRDILIRDNSMSTQIIVAGDSSVKIIDAMESGKDKELIPNVRDSRSLGAGVSDLYVATLDGFFYCPLAENCSKVKHIGFDENGNKDFYSVSYPFLTSEDGIYKYNNGKWEKLLMCQLKPLRAIVALSESEAWAVGDNGTILHFKDGACSSENRPDGVKLWSLWRDASAGDLWAVGERGTILRRRPRQPQSP